MDAFSTRTRGQIYTEVPDEATRDALGKLSGWLDQADEPPTQPEETNRRVDETEEHNEE
jgi:hypothetical protein